MPEDRGEIHAVPAAEGLHMEMPAMIAVKKVVKENRSTKTIFLDTAIKADPGQFVMLWLPGVEEKPFSVSHIGKELGVTVQERGAYTQKLLRDVEAGTLLGVRGPYGNGFDVSGVKNACVIAGGCGAAPVAPLAEILPSPVAIAGARTNTDLLFTKRLNNCSHLYITTDDGSAGEKGFTTDVLQTLINEKHMKFDSVFACGPEVMMRSVFEICEARNVPCQLSLERYMICGFGICGSCACDGRLVCKDGPVFKSAELRTMKEFGKLARIKSGKLVSIKEYSEWRCE